jgi:hypothetical protein
MPLGQFKAIRANRDRVPRLTPAGLAGAAGGG